MMWSKLLDLFGMLCALFGLIIVISFVVVSCGVHVEKAVADDYSERQQITRIVKAQERQAKALESMAASLREMKRICK